MHCFLGTEGGPGVSFFPNLTLCNPEHPLVVSDPRTEGKKHCVEFWYFAWQTIAGQQAFFPWIWQAFSDAKWMVRWIW